MDLVEITEQIAICVGHHESHDALLREILRDQKQIIKNQHRTEDKINQVLAKLSRKTGTIVVGDPVP